MDDEIHRALGPDRAIDRGVPAHQNLVIPQAQLATPQIAAFGDIPASVQRLELDAVAFLTHLDRLGCDQLVAVIEIMGWASTAMAKRYQHVTAEVRKSVAEQVGGAPLAERQGLGQSSVTYRVSRTPSVECN